RSRGFGFVDMDQDSIGAAIDALNGHSIDGRNLKVNEAKEQKARDRD
ncbi:MAG: RNA-binding protein, partial [Spirochaetota bacterium]|nr:RNA-binding protein [Spirochaetota bacterium]